MNFSCLQVMMEALLVTIVSVGRPAGAQRNFHDILSSLSSELAGNSTGTGGAALLNNTSTDNSEETPASVVPTTRPRGLGLPCTADAECLASRGLSCQFWVCACAPQTPVSVEVRGEPRCVPARSLYQPCRFHQECNYTSSPMRCVERLCLCPPPFEPTAKGGCAAPRLSLVTRLVRLATPTTAGLAVTAALMAAFIFIRMLPRSKSRWGSTSGEEGCSAQVPPSRKLGPAEACAMQTPPHLRWLPLRQNSPARPLPIRRIRMPSAQGAGPTTPAVPSTPEFTSSVDSVVIASSVEGAFPTSSQTDEWKMEKASRPDSGSGNVISSSSDDVADVHVPHKGSTTPAPRISLLPASVRLLPFKSIASTHSLSIKWGTNISSSSSSKRDTAAREKPLKSAMIPGKAVLPDDDDSEVPLVLAGSRRQRSVAFAVDGKQEGDQSSLRSEASEDKEQSSIAVGALRLSQSVRPDAKLSPDDSTSEATEEVIATTKKSSSTTAPSPSSEADPPEHRATLEDRGAERPSKPMTLPDVSSQNEVLPRPGGVVPGSSHQTEDGGHSGTPAGCEGMDHLEPGASPAVIAGSPLLSPMPPLPLIRRRFDIGCTRTSGKLNGSETTSVLLDNPAGSVKSFAHTDREEPSVRKVNTDADNTSGVTLQYLQGISVQETPGDDGSGLAVGDLPDIIPSIKVTSPSGFEGRLDSVVLWEPGHVDDLWRRETLASASGSFTAVENGSVESVMSTRGSSEMAGVPFGATLFYSELQSQGWPPASSMSTWGSFEKVPFTEGSDVQVAADFAEPTMQSASSTEQPDPACMPTWYSVDKLQPSSRTGTLTSQTSARPTPMKRSVRFRRTESNQLQAVSQCDSQEETPFLFSHTPSLREAETVITKLVESEVVFERKRSVTSEPEDVVDIRLEDSANVLLQEAPSEFPEPSEWPHGASGSKINAADTSESSSISKKHTTEHSSVSDSSQLECA
ncbi:serine-rich adhesin for platelets-like isoform X2 [Dermacentor albipictus]|uniref:serine-rich adhesin for platelets-like isoform X2 n=1 Tax=Dermacentor albipictus TaxID=60249 RepID=UPI0031FCF854